MRAEQAIRRVACFVAAVLVVSAMAGCAGAGMNQSTKSPDVGSARRSLSSAPAAQAAPGYAGAPSDGGASSPAQSSAAKSTASSPIASRMVIRSGSVRLRVDKAPDAVTKLRALAKRFGGVVAELQLATDTGGDGSPQPLAEKSGAVGTGLPFSASLTVLVPVAKFDDFRAEASKLGAVLSESTSDSDVTQQHVDLKARLDSAKVEEARLRTFFDDAKSVNDMLSVEHELARVRADIESMTAQLATLERQAAMSTLVIELVEPQPIVRPSSGIDWGFGDALTTGVQAMVSLLKAALVFVVATAPVWILVIALVLLARWRLRVRARRSAVPTHVPAEK
jgi:hypothetical protein